MNIGRYVFAQVMDFLPRYEFKKIVKKYNTDFHAKNLNSYNQLLHLSFGQIDRMHVFTRDNIVFNSPFRCHISSWDKKYRSSFITCTSKRDKRLPYIRRVRTIFDP